MNLVLKDGATISASKIALPLVAKLTTRGEARRTAPLISSAMTSRLPCVKNVATCAITLRPTEVC